MPVSLISPFASRVSASKTSTVSAENVITCDFRADTPASHTLSVLSLEPETMVLPSGEKPTDQMVPLCALCFSAFSSKDAAASTEAVRYGLRVGGCQC